MGPAWPSYTAGTSSFTWSYFDDGACATADADAPVSFAGYVDGDCLDLTADFAAVAGHDVDPFSVRAYCDAGNLALAVFDG